MQEWIHHTLTSATLSPAVLGAAFLLGVLGALNPCCKVIVLGAVTGYSGSLGEGRGRSAVLAGGLAFMIGTVVALGIVGAVAGFISQAVESSLGIYWKIFAGLVLVFFGLASLGWVPFRLPNFGPRPGSQPASLRAAMLYGFAIGGGASACSASCNPVLPVALGMATLQGRALWGAVILAVFAVGYALPLTAGVIGLGLGLDRLSAGVARAVPVIKSLAGLVMIATGFYLLLTL